MFHSAFALSFYDLHVVVKRLLNANKELANLKYIACLTPAHFAAMGGASNALRIIIEHGAQAICTAKDVHGALPLHYAAQYGHSDAAKVLIEGMDTHEVCDNAGLTAADRAEENGKPFDFAEDVTRNHSDPTQSDSGQQGYGTQSIGLCSGA